MALSLDQFYNRYNGQQLTNNGGGYLGECVSLAARYAQEVQGVSNADGVIYCSNTGGARDLYEQFDLKLPQYYDRIPYGQPRKYGDLVIWGDNHGSYGDVAIAVDEGTRVFGQLGTPVFQSARLRYDTKPPLGYLRLKGTKEEDMPASYEAANIYAQTILFRDMSEDEFNKYHKGKTRDQLFDDFRAAGERGTNLKKLIESDNQDLDEESRKLKEALKGFLD